MSVEEKKPIVRPHLNGHQRRKILNEEWKRIMSIIDCIVRSSPSMSDDKETIAHFEYDLKCEMEHLRKLGLCFLKHRGMIKSSNPVVDLDEEVYEMVSMPIIESF